MPNVKLDETKGIAILEPDGMLSEADFASVASIIDPYLEKSGKLRILVIPITGTGFIRSPDLPNATCPMVSL